MSDTPDKSKKRFDGMRTALPDDPKKPIKIDEIKGALPPDPTIPKKPVKKDLTQS